jgi:hypothetical protein
MRRGAEGGDLLIFAASHLVVIIKIIIILL